MHRSTTRWTTAAAVAALIALPAAGAAQSTGTTPDPQQPPPSTQPRPQPQPQPQEPTATTSQQPAAGPVDAAAAKKHLSEARDALSQVTSMPEAAKLQGDARTQVSQLIANFNELITTQNDWRSAYGKVDASLTALLGPESSDPSAAAATPAGTAGTAGTTGTAGTAGTAGTTGSTPTAAAAGTPNLEPAIRTKLAEFRSHLKLFEKAAGGDSASAGAMAPTPATGASASPANPATSAPANPDPTSPNPTSPSQPPSSAGAVGTSGVTPSPTASMAPADQAKAAGQVAANSEADKHLDAIAEILNKSKTGALTKAETTELKKHVEQLRAILKQK